MGAGERRLKRLIVTGDDFGASLSINEAIEESHRHGILTAASLMVGAPAAADAIARAHRLPRLGVGLHVVVTRGRPLSPQTIVPGLVDGWGEFDNNLVRAGFRYFFLPSARRQLAIEIRAQFEAFQKSGLALDHVNAHNHIHMHPTVFGLMVDIGREYGAPAMRVPYEPTPGESAADRVVDWLLRVAWIAPMKKKLRRNALRHNDVIFGLRDTGRLNRARLLDLIARVPDGVSEIFCHPATTSGQAADVHAEGFAFKDELEALLDGDVRRRIEQFGIVLSSYRAVAW